jgi:amylosucrase
MSYFHQISRDRLFHECLETATEELKQSEHIHQKVFLERFKLHFPALLDELYKLYADQLDFAIHAQKLAATLASSWICRPSWLQKDDTDHETHPDWFTDAGMIGAVCYVDLFAGDLSGLEKRIPYLRELGVTYLHLMPLFDVPLPENDGGYAVRSYRKVNPRLGTMKQLSKLAQKMRKMGISLVLDFINNHTSNEHMWAQKAREGDLRYQQFYYLFPDRSIPDQFERNLREIFPEVRRGNFTWDEPLKKWVWTTFHSYQWDLNYRNPAVFTAMTREMLDLANVGVRFLRLDAVPFTWKQMGTTCENLPQAHTIIQALNRCARIAAPGLLFKSEAIVHPDDVIKYVDPGKCQVSYNPTLMALLWESLATREVKLMRESLLHRFQLPKGTAWVNYVRSHDDIGWTFSDADARQIGLNGDDHRRFLNSFYSGQFPGGFARGRSFQFNPSNGDMRVCGTTASLAGLEEALETVDQGRALDAMGRTLLIYGITMCIGGLPLLYLGDETGVCNDYTYVDDPAKRNDSRWIHRAATNWALVEQVQNGNRLESYQYEQLTRLIHIRKQTPVFGDNFLYLVDTAHPSVLGFVKTMKMTANANRSHGEGAVLVLANFREKASLAKLPENWSAIPLRELITGQQFCINEQIELAPYQLCWFQVATN